MRFDVKLVILVLLAQISGIYGINSNFSCGILQTHCNPARRPEYQFGGFFLPNSGVKWHCRRRNVLDKLCAKLSDFNFNSHRNNNNSNNYSDTNYNNSSKSKNKNDYEYRILILNPLYVFYEMCKRNLISYKLSDDFVTVKKNSFLHKFLNNSN